MENEQILSSVFKVFSGTCVHNPFEVIIVILSLCISLSLLSSSSSSTIHSLKQMPSSIVPRALFQMRNPIENPMLFFNFSFLMLLRCLAFVCIFVQLKSLRKMNSKFVLSLSVFITLVSSILFNNALLNWFMFEIPNNLLLFIDIVLYTLVIIDLKKCNMILNNALEMSNLREAKTNVVNNFAHFATSSSLDTVFLILLVALGNLSDSHEIKNFSMFSCILLASNFFIFITIYPALLSLILQFNKSNAVVSHAEAKSTQHKHTQQPKLTKNILFSSLTNPVLVYVKILMTLFLILIHLKLKFFNVEHSEAEVKMNNSKSIHNSNEESMKTKSTSQQMDTEQNDQIKFYTECCLLLTLIIFIVTKLFKPIVDNEDETDTELSNEMNNETEWRTVSTQTTNEAKEMFTDKEIKANCDNVEPKREKRTMKECLEMLNQRPNKLVDDFLDEEIVELVKEKHLLIYKLESYFSNPLRGVHLRRKIILKKLEDKVANLDSLPFDNYNYKKVAGSCCENVIGYVPVPLGVAGPLLIDGKQFYIPMATTEGTLVASTNRGCTALTSSNGVLTKVLSDGMSRGPAIKFSTAMRAAEVKEWLENEENFARIKKAFDSTSRFAKLSSTKCCIVGRYLYIRFVSKTGDAMGMNMLSKGSEKALLELQLQFPDAQIMSVSGNYCTDKKASAINWIEGRGKSVVCEAIVKGEVVKSVLKTSTKALVDLNLTKNLVGSAIAGTIGGFNAHAANIVAAIFIACGQDPAQVVESSNCLTWMECMGEDLYISCTMPSLEVGTVGGGTFLDAQSTCLKMLGVYGSCEENAGDNASQLARIIAASVLAGELSLMSALASGHLVNSHMRYNRSTIANINTHNNQTASNEIHNFL